MSFAGSTYHETSALFSLSLPHLVVLDIAAIGLPAENYPKEGKKQMVPSLRFRRWRDVERYLLSWGADAEASEDLKKPGAPQEFPQNLRSR
jgi:hypothetical protein